MSWNYRVIKHVQHATWFEIVEAHYVNDGEPVFYGEASLMWEEGEKGEEVLKLMSEALDKPILTEDDFK